MDLLHKCQIFSKSLALRLISAFRGRTPKITGHGYIGLGEIRYYV